MTKGTQFRLNQILGSLAMNCAMPTEKTKALVKKIFEGRISAEAAKLAVINRYKCQD